jgi:hypothetical protein
MKRVLDLKNDAELNEASWEAAKGAAVGAARVCCFIFFGFDDKILRFLYSRSYMHIHPLGFMLPFGPGGLSGPLYLIPFLSIIHPFLSSTHLQPSNQSQYLHSGAYTPLSSAAPPTSTLLFTEA